MRGQRGSISVVAAAVIGLALVCSLGVADVAKVVVARAHAQAAADSAALAAAQELAFASGQSPAALAAGYAARNGAALLACICSLGTTQAVVEVGLPVGHLMLVPGSRTVIAWARAVVEVPRGGAVAPAAFGRAPGYPLAEPGALPSA